MQLRKITYHFAIASIKPGKHYKLTYPWVKKKTPRGEGYTIFVLTAI